MKKIDAKNCLYFGIKPYRGDNVYYSDDDTCTEVSLKYILLSGFIMTRNSLKEKKIISKRDYITLCQRMDNWQGDDAVSIACHPSNNDVWAKYSGGFIVDDDDAYQSFACTRNPVLLLNPSLLSELQLKNDRFCKRMLYELQVIGDIPIRYVLAVGLSEYLSDDIDDIKQRISRNMPYSFSDSSDLVKYLHGYISEEEAVHSYYERINRYIDIVRKIIPEMPIINKYSGHELPTFEEQCERVKELKKIYK